MTALLTQNPGALSKTDPGAQTQVNALLAYFETLRFRFASESQLQDGVAQALIQCATTFERECALSLQDRPDFVLENGIVIEIKIQGSLAQALRQINRYAQHPRVQHIILMGSPGWLLKVPGMIGGKPVHTLRITGSLL